MAKRLRVTMADADYREIQRAARSRCTSISAWVRDALALALRRESEEIVEKKLAAIRLAAQCEFPTPDIDQMLKEIE